MTVKVTLPNQGGGERTQTHPKGSSFTVVEDHLYVQKAPSDAMADTVAIYAPKGWTSAVVAEDDKTA